MRALCCYRSVVVPSRCRHCVGRHTSTHAAAQQTSTSPDEPVLRGGVSLDSLQLAAVCAKLADHAYFDADPALSAASLTSEAPDAPLAALLAADGFSLVAAGRSSVTRWYVADDEARRTRHVVVRGVAWRDTRVDVPQLTTRLASAWRAQLTPGVPVYAHAGALRCAQELWADGLEQHIKAAVRSSPKRIALSGHSLGGAIALLTACQCRLQWGIPPALLAPVHAFGAPPVLACDAPATSLPQVLQLRPDGMRTFVLDSDPVPLVWTAETPLNGVNAAQLVITSRAGALLGYGHHGELYLCRWLGAGGGSVTRAAIQGPPLTGEVEVSTANGTPEETGKTTADNLSLLSLIRQALDHNRRSYTDALGWLVTLAVSQSRLRS